MPGQVRGVDRVLRWRRQRGAVPLLVTSVILVVLIAPALAVMIWTSVTASGSGITTGSASFAAFGQNLVSGNSGSFFLDTLEFAIPATAVGLGIGLFLAVAVERLRIPGARVGAYLVVFLGFATPGMLRVVGWVFLLGGRFGLLNRILHTNVDIESLWGMVLVEGLFWAPVAFLLLDGPFRNFNEELVEAAGVTGAGPLTRFRRIAIPLLRPAMLSVGILLTIGCVQAFEVPLFLGVPAHVETVTASIYISLGNEVLPQYGPAASYGVVLVLLLGVLLVAYLRSTSVASRFQTVSGRGFRAARYRPGERRWWRYPCAGLVWAFVLLEAIPVAFITVSSFIRNIGSSTMSLTLSNYSDLSASQGLVGSVVHSLVVAAVAATATVVLSLVVAWLRIRTSVAGRSLLAFFVSLPLVVPGIVVGLAYLLLALRLHLPIYGTVWIFVLAYVVEFVPYGLRYSEPALVQLAPDLEEQAVISGAGRFDVARRVLLPLLSTTVIGTWIFVFLLASRELGASSLLYTAKSQVVATQILDLWQNGNLGVLSAFGTIVLVASVSVAGAMYGLTRRFAW